MSTQAALSSVINPDDTEAAPTPPLAEAPQEPLRKPPSTHKLPSIPPETKEVSPLGHVPPIMTSGQF